MKYEEMKRKLIEACDSYYNKSESIMSDKEFDILKDEFAKLYPDDEFITKIGSPVPEVTVWKKESHKIPMASLDKVNSLNEFVDWVEKKKCNDFIIEDKIDGISINLEYEKGYLVAGITRGDGRTGENILRNIVKMKNVKRRIGDFTGSIRGEIVLCKDDFIALNHKMKENTEKEFINERNAASGIAKRFDGKNSEFLSIFYYDVTGDWKNEEEKLKWIESQGLKTCYWKRCNKDECIKIYNDFENKLRSQIPYIIDGLVIKINDSSLQKKLGYSKGTGNPNSQVAWKFEAETAKTKVINVEWQMGNSGRITPVLIMEPVNLGGVTIQRASIHNLEIFDSFDLHEGDAVVISRANDVIPFLKENLGNDKNRGNKLKIPTNCPYCDHKLSVDGVYLVCKNNECSGGEIGNLKKWIKKIGLKGIATATIEKLYKAGLVKNIADLYKLKPDMISMIEGFGPCLAKKIVETLNSKKELNFCEFISGLNIPNFSDKTAELLEKNGLDTVRKILVMGVSDLANIKGIGNITANAIIDGLKKKLDIINKLIDAGITIINKDQKEVKKKGLLSGKKIVFTGTLNITRSDAQKMVIEAGGECPTSLTKDTDYLVMAELDSNSLKAQKAKKYGTKILTEDQFIKMINSCKEKI